MSTLLLRLAGPLQAWGSASRFTRRGTDPQPTKSGVLGLLAAALGRDRTAAMDDLAGLGFGVRLDQPGRVERDFQTARSLDGTRTMPLSQRFYLADAVFVAAVEGDPDVVGALDTAVRRPHFIPYLGRRSCPPAGPVALGVRDGGLREVLAAEPWQAAPRVRRRQPVRVEVDVVADAVPSDAERFLVRDVPQSFDPQQRQYAVRSATRFQVELDNPQGSAAAPARGRRPAGPHDPIDALGEP